MQMPFLRSVRFRVLALVAALLLVGAVLLAWRLLADFEQYAVYNFSQAYLEVIGQGIEATMVVGDTDLTVELLEDLEKNASISEIRVLDAEAKPCFLSSTAAQSDSHTDLRAEDARALGRFAADPSTFAVPRGDGYVFYRPLENHEACMDCHEDQGPILGAVEVTTAHEVLAKQLAGTAITTLGGTMGLWLAAVLVVVLLALGRLIVGPIGRLASAASRLAQGELGFRVRVDSDDEIGKVAEGLQGAIDGLTSVVKGIRAATQDTQRLIDEVGRDCQAVQEGTATERVVVDEIVQALGVLKRSMEAVADNAHAAEDSATRTETSVHTAQAATDRLAAEVKSITSAIGSTSLSMDQISGRIRVISTGCAQLSTATEDALGVLGQINDAISRINQATSGSARLAVDVADAARAYREGAIYRVSQGIQKIRASVDVTADHFDQLRRQSEEIGKVIDVINDVTESSRLLALNAAILAAQAGEHGRGFSVVAEEIDALANRATTSVAEVARIISTVQLELGQADAHVRGAVASVEEGSAAFQEAERDLSRIVDSSERASRSATTIEQAAAEQLRAVGIIQEAMNGIRNRANEIDRAVAEQNQSVGTVARSTEEMTRSSAQVGEAAEVQARGFVELSQAFREVLERTQEMDRAVREHQVAVSQIGRALDVLGPMPEKGRQLAENVLNGFASIGRGHDRLREEISRFRISDDESGAEAEE